MTKTSPAAVRVVPGLVLLAAGIWFGFVVLLAQRGGIDLSLGLSSGAIAAIAALSGVAAVVYFLSVDAVNGSSSWPRVLIAAGLVCLAIGTTIGLFVAPPEQYMGETQRIMYVHVPTAWNALLAITFGFASAVLFLFTSDFRWDSRMEASLEVGVVLAFLLCCQGAIWAKPTWGVWWDWDPRLTTTAVLVFAFLGILALRKFVDDPLRRGVWSSVAAIIAYVDVPIVYYSVKWWNSLHQAQSTPSTVARQFWLPLRANAFGILFLMTGFIMLRARIARLRLEEELAPPPLVEGELGEAV